MKILFADQDLCEFFVRYNLGAAKLVTSFGGGKKAGGRRTPSMAMMLTGRILLGHVFTLAVVSHFGFSGSFSKNKILKLTNHIYLIDIYLLGARPARLFFQWRNSL